MVKAMRDTLLNYVNAVERQLAAGKPGQAGRRREGGDRPREGRGRREAEGDGRGC